MWNSHPPSYIHNIKVKCVQKVALTEILHARLFIYLKKNYNNLVVLKYFEILCGGSYSFFKSRELRRETFGRDFLLKNVKHSVVPSLTPQVLVYIFSPLKSLSLVAHTAVLS